MTHCSHSGSSAAQIHVHGQNLFYTGWNHGVCRSTGFKCMKQFVLDLGLDLDLDPTSLARGFGWKGSVYFS